MPVNVYVADNQTLFRQGLICLLEDKCDVTVVGEGADGFACLNDCNNLNPNIVIINADISGIDGIKTISIMREQQFMAKTLILADEADGEKLIKAMDAGCDGFLLKSCDVSELRKAVFALYNGEKYIPDNLVDKLNDTKVIRSSAEDKLNELTRREVEVLKLIAEGLFNKEIASKLNISERTVKNHISSIFKKITVNDRTQAAVFAIKNNLVSL